MNNSIELQPTSWEDREKVFAWLAQSDITCLMAGPPTYPEHVLPTWEEFTEDYDPLFIDSNATFKRSFLIVENGSPIGHINYDGLDIHPDCAELDIWLSSSEVCGQGHGVLALRLIMKYVFEKLGVEKFIIRPSRRNPRAVRAYEKAGFEVCETTDNLVKKFGPGDYVDTVFMFTDYMKEKK